MVDPSKNIDHVANILIQRVSSEELLQVVNYLHNVNQHKLANKIASKARLRA